MHYRGQRSTGRLACPSPYPAGLPSLPPRPADVALASAAGAADYTLRIQTHHSPETLPGKIFLQFVQDVGTLALTMALAPIDPTQRLGRGSRRWRRPGGQPA